LQAVLAENEMNERTARNDGELLDWNDITIYPWCMGCRSAQPAKSTDQHANVLPRCSKTAPERTRRLRSNPQHGGCMRQADDVGSAPSPLPGDDEPHDRCSPAAVPASCPSNAQIASNPR
jgi:hypothetical protein